MKIGAGFYKLPDMFSKTFFAGGYKLTNSSDRFQTVELRSSTRDEPYYCGGIGAGDSVVIWLEEGYLRLGAEVEISPYQIPEEFE